MCGQICSGSSMELLQFEWVLLLTESSILTVFKFYLNIPAQSNIKMLNPKFRQLEKQGIPKLCLAASEDEEIIVQAYNISLNKNDKLTCLISDGRHSIKAFLKDKNILKPQKNEYSIIRIKNHVVADSGKKIGIVLFDLICEYGSLIGAPELLDEIPPTNSLDQRVFEIDPNLIKVKHINMFLEEKALTQAKSNNLVKTQEKKREMRQMRVPEARPLNGSVKDYETIKGLFVGLKNWHLLCRISRIDYQEFQKKNSDKLVRMLTIDLIDRSDVKITGTFFYDAADKFKDILKLNSVYKISEGGITNDTYNNSRNQKMSPFKLIFGLDSVFEEVSDVHIIARSEDSAVTLNDVLNKGIVDQQFDIIGILVEIEEPKEVNKGDKKLTMWSWVIADPMQQKKIQAVTWNDNVKPDYSLIGKTVLLSRFTLHSYNGSLTLNSKPRCNIQAANYPQYQMEEDKVMVNFRTYEYLSERKNRDQHQAQGVVFTNMKELSSAIETMDTGQTLKSDLDVFVNRLSMKKWYYEGCPGCNKSAEKGTSCHCGKYVQQTVPHFIMPVELVDSCGSLYSTAYDDQSKRIFWDQEGVIHKLMNFDEKQLKDVVEDYYYQEFRVRIYTKRDQEGRIKHNMGKLEHIIPQKRTMENVEKIRQMMQHSF